MNAEAYDGNTPLHLAISLKNHDIAKLLVKSGADPNLKSRQFLHNEDSEGEIVGKDAYELCDGDSKVSTHSYQFTNNTHVPFLIVIYIYAVTLYLFLV